MRKLLVGIFAVTYVLASSTEIVAEGELYKTVLRGINAARKTSEELFDDVLYVQKTLNNIKEHKALEARTDRWKSLVKNYNQLEISIKGLVVDSSYNDQQFKVSPEEFIACETRGSAVARLRDQVRALGTAVDDAEYVADQLAGIISESSAAGDALDVITKLYEQLIKVPIVREKFQWEWFDVETNVRGSLGNVRVAAGQKRKKVLAERDLLLIKKKNLDGNLRDLVKTECSIAGIWDGSWHGSGESGTYILTLSRERAGYSCVMKYPNGSVACDLIEVSIGEHRVRIARSALPPPSKERGSKSVFELYISPDYRTMLGDQLYLNQGNILKNDLRKR